MKYIFILFCSIVFCAGEETSLKLSLEEALEIGVDGAVEASITLHTREGMSFPRARFAIEGDAVIVDRPYGRVKLAYGEIKTVEIFSIPYVIGKPLTLFLKNGDVMKAVIEEVMDDHIQVKVGHKYNMKIPKKALYPAEGLPPLQTEESYLDAVLTLDHYAVESGKTDFECLQNIDLYNLKVEDLSPLRDLAGLEKVNLCNTLIKDLSPLAELKHLKELDISYTNIKDLRQLSGFTTLNKLYIEGLQVEDLSPLAGLKELRELFLGSTSVADLSPLTGMTHLKRLNAVNSPVKDLAPLAGLRELEFLELNRTHVEDLGPVAQLPSMHYLILEQTRVKDLTPLAELKEIRKLDVSHTAVENLAPLSDFPHLWTLLITEAPVRDLSPLKHMKNMTLCMTEEQMKALGGYDFRVVIRKR